MKHIIIGTRGSRLARVQSAIVKNLIASLYPAIQVEEKIITTAGDKNMKPIPLDTIGKGWFTKDIDKQLLDGKINVAVHSLKDILDVMHPELLIAAIPKREDAREAFISRNNIRLENLQKHAIIGTDSTRRKMQILKIRKDIIVKSIRGNVDTRLAKLYSEEYDAVLLAVAGLRRLGLQNRITHYFGEATIVPSPGQGALAIVIKKTDTELHTLLSPLNDEEAVLTTQAEREFSTLTNGGCSLPVGGFAKIKGETMTLYGMIGSVDEKHSVKGFSKGNKTEPEKVAQKLADKLLHAQKFVVLTRTREENNMIAEKLAAMDIRSISCPSIAISKNLSGDDAKKYMANLSFIDWILFTSSNGVNYFMQVLDELHVPLPQKILIGVVGDKTELAAKKYGLPITCKPKIFTAEHLANDLPDIKGKKILLPRSSIGDKTFNTILEKRGANVIAMPIYKTTLKKIMPTKVRSHIKTNQIRCLTFASPSAVEGFIEMTGKQLGEKVLTLPVLSIGPITTKAVKKYGFKYITTAKVHTTDGMLRKLEKNIL
jgi:hydroxymethylbilane synthase